MGPEVTWVGARSRARKVLLLAVLGVLGSTSTAVAQQYPVSAEGLRLDRSAVEPGGTVELQGDGFQPGASLTVSLDDAVVSNVGSDDAGSFSLRVTLPEDLAPGGHRMAVSGPDPGGRTRTLEAALEARPVGGATTPLGRPEESSRVPVAGITTGLVLVAAVLGTIVRRRRAQEAVPDLADVTT
jgi:hypothetical protein